jgi:glycosyltransferase involved in cell wall biosynthesis
MSRILKLKHKNPEKVFIHRIDGPIFFIRARNKDMDKLIFDVSDKIADFAVFQSKWSFEKCRELGFGSEKYTIIYNAPDKSIFNSEDRVEFSQDRKIRLIATSWSENINKGFNTYKFLDENLDFKKFEFVFLGNSPLKFKNIKHIPPVNSRRLAQELKNSDIFITASQNDPCSNSLIEALSCGLPALVLASGGHPELIGYGGEVFKNNEEVFEKLEKIVANYDDYQKNIPAFDIERTAEEYLKIFQNRDFPSSRKINFFDLTKFLLKIHAINFRNRLSYFLRNFS